MKSDKLTNLIGIYLLIALAAVIAMGLYFIRPILVDASKLKAETAKINGDIEGLKRLDTDTNTLRANYQSIRGERDKILAQLPVSSEEERLLVLLNDLASQNGVILGTFRPDALSTTLPPNGALSIYPATINATGTYSAVQAFLRSVENGARFVDVQSGVFTGTGDGQALAARISLQAYYQQSLASGVSR